MDLEMLHAQEELGVERFQKHLRSIFGITCLDFVKTIVINLPEPCYANCEYCFDKELRKHSTSTAKFMEVCEKVFKEFPNVKSVSITGGSLNPSDFNKLVELIRKYLPESRISWNTNGIGIDENYQNGISKLNRINLHRHSLDETENRIPFKAQKEVISIEKAKSLMGQKLFIRVTVDESFDIDKFIEPQIPLYINRLLPGTDATNENFKKTMQKLNISDIDKRRRNVYINCFYHGIPVRVCMGDKLAECVPGRKPTYLNVAIIHRSGIVCGSWYENDKVIFNPNN